MLKRILEVALGAAGFIFLCVLFVWFPFEWGRNSAMWQRKYGTSRKETYYRAAAIPALALLGGYFCIPSMNSKAWVFWLLVAAALSSGAGVWWEFRRNPEPLRLYRAWSDDDSPEGLPLPSKVGPCMFDGYPGYECWKCGNTRVGFWSFEATIQDKHRKDYAFAWMPVCDDCAAKARATVSGPTST